MGFLAETVFRQRSVAAFVTGSQAVSSSVQHVHSLGPARIIVPPLPTGRHFFELWPVRELPEPGLWSSQYYDSFAPPLFVLRDVLVHSSAGILAVGDTVIAETLAHTNPRDHRYRALVRGIALPLGEVTSLPGTHISLLAAGHADYRHAMLGGLARLVSVPDNYLVAAQSLLVPAGSAAQAEALALLDLLPSLAVRHVGQAETFRVETLVLPLSVCGEAAYHPCLAEFFRRISVNIAPSPARLPRRLYIDHRGSGIRPLRNEAEVIGALAELGFAPVRLEALSLADQARLFRQAEAIVSPHGSGLTNLGFCRPGCLIVELLMDAYCDWSFRNLAALMDLHYDCVLGRASRPWHELDLAFHRTSWDISVNHVVAAVAHSLSAPKRQSAAA